MGRGPLTRTPLEVTERPAIARARLVEIPAGTELLRNVRHMHAQEFAECSTDELDTAARWLRAATRQCPHLRPERLPWRARAALLAGRWPFAVRPPGPGLGAAAPGSAGHGHRRIRGRRTRARHPDAGGGPARPAGPRTVWRQSGAAATGPGRGLARRRRPPGKRCLRAAAVPGGMRHRHRTRRHRHRDRKPPGAATARARSLATAASLLQPRYCRRAACGSREVLGRRAASHSCTSARMLRPSSRKASKRLGT